MTHSWAMLIAAMVVQLVAHQHPLIVASPIGVCWGLNGDNLPTPSDVVGLYQRSQVQLVRLYEPKPEILEALKGSNLCVSLGTRNEDLQSLSSSQEAANAWVATNVAPYKDNVSFCWVTLGNEVIPGPFATYVAGAMNNILNALQSAGLDRVKVTTVVPANVLGSSSPPSSGMFSNEVAPVMVNVASFLSHTGAPLMVNLYPYFTYSSDADHVSLEFATFESKDPVIIDGEFKYYNLLDAMADAFNAALEKINASDVYLTISESGWPSAGNEPYTSIDNAKTYNTNLMNHVLGGGTPRKPDHLMDTFIFEMFNEDLKSPGAEQNFGLFYPNMQPVYPIF